MDHCRRAHLPSNREQAVRWAKRDRSAGPKLAALLNKLRLSAEETGILIFGCTWGLSVLMTSRVVRLLSPNPANIVGVDTCRPLLDLAEATLDLEAEHVAGVRDLVSFLEMDVKRIGDQANIDMIHSMFPRGISTIIVTEMFRDLRDDDVHLVVRDLMALLPPGGRLVFDIYENSLGWGAAHIVSTSFVPPRPVAIADIASPSAIGQVELGTRAACENLSGTASSGAEVRIQHTECIRLCRLWEEFSRLSDNPVGPINPPTMPWTTGDNDHNIRICEEAIFNPRRNQFYRNHEYLVQYSNGFGNFAHSILHMLATCYQREERVEYHRALGAISERIAGGFLMNHLDMQLRRYRGDLFEGPDHSQGMGLRRLAAEIFDDEYNARRITGLPTMQSTYVKFSPASVLVILRRA